ncbi:metallophosphoesterase [Luteolibacter sp. AS25]|uniref:metallophosphoesterase n=1 Tax=Luteolibacter sp. AS25 TaxID=3135776 RepID=UPI00398AC0F7
MLEVLDEMLMGRRLMKNDFPPIGQNISRRRLLKTLFCSSVAMNLNLKADAKTGSVSVAGRLDFLAVGDYGKGDERQFSVARGMKVYTLSLATKPDGLFLLGDNFYGPMPGGVKSVRWIKGFSEPYPAKVYPGPCWAVLGNHDYRDTPGNEQIQLRYAASLKRGTRWTMPAKHYRVDYPADDPQVTFIMIDTNWKSLYVNNRRQKKQIWMSAEEEEEQRVWLEGQLAGKRAPFTVVVGHHQLYSNTKYGDNPAVIEELGEVLQKHKVHLYLCGHEHDLQHLELDGLCTSFVVSGAGAGSRGEVTKERENSAADLVGGFSHLSLDGERLYVRNIDEKGNICHAFSKGLDHSWRIEA